MYGGNVPGQFNGNRLPANKDYNPMYRMSAPGQSQIRTPAMQTHSMQQYQNMSYPGASASQMQYQTSQGPVYSTDPFNYNPGKATGDMQRSLSGMSATYAPNEDMYAGSQPRPNYPGGASGDISLPPENSLSMQQYQQGKPMSAVWNKPANDESSMVYGQSHSSASAMYNGSQYIGGVPSIQPGSRPSNPSVMQHSVQSYMGSDGRIQHQRSMPSYQQMSTLSSQFPQTQVSGNSSQASMYLQNQYMGQNHPRSSSYMIRQPQMSSSAQQVSKHMGQYDENSMRMQHQNSMQQLGMKPGQTYHMKVSSSTNSGAAMNQTGPPQMVGTPGNPLQQAMSPHHTSPLSPPVRGSAATRIVPPASPQLQTSRTTPQYPAPQVSPHTHPAGSMSPSARMAGYSPKQQMGSNFSNQSQLNAGYKSGTQTRTPIHRNDGASRGFMSPPQMMSPPPVQNPIISQSSRLPNVSMTYNGDASNQQYYTQPGRYPHSWQGGRQQTPTPPSQKVSVNVGANMGAPIPRPTHFNTSQSAQQSPSQFGQAPMPVNQPGFQQMQRTPSGNLKSNVMLSNTPSTSFNMDPSNDFESDFNLDSLLGDPVEGTGSFMQQLQDVIPSSTSNIFPTSAPNLAQAPSATAPSQPLQIPSSMTGITTNSFTTKVDSQNVVGPAVVSTVSNTAFLNVSSETRGNSNASTGTSISNSSFKVNDEDSGEITLESTEQDLYKAAASLPIPFADANLPPMNLPMNDIKEQQSTLSVSQASTLPTDSSAVPTVSTAADISVLPVSSSVLTSPTSSVATPYANRKLSSEPVGQSLNVVKKPELNSIVTSTSASVSSELLLTATASFQSTSTMSTTTVAPSLSPQPIVTQSVLPTTTPSVQPSATLAVPPSTVLAVSPSAALAIPPSTALAVPPSTALAVPPSATLPAQPPLASLSSTASRSVMPPVASHVQPNLQHVPQPSPVAPTVQPNLQHLPQPSSVTHPNLSTNNHGIRPSTVSRPYSSQTVQVKLPSQSSEMVRSKIMGESPYPRQHPMMNVPPRGTQPGVPNVGPMPRMHAPDGSMVRTQGGPHYSPMHPQFQQRPYGPHGPYPPGPYPSSSAHPGRLPYPQASPHRSRPEYMGPRPYHRMHPPPQHLQQQMQGLKHEAQQLQLQLQRVQQEEAETNPDVNLSAEQPRRSDQIRRRLVEIDHSIKQIMMQLHNHPPPHAPPQQIQDPNQSIALHHHGGSAFLEGDTLGSALEDGSKKKRPRKKPSKPPKPEGEESKKPPKKKKKKDLDGDLPGSEKKKKKKVKKIDTTASSFADDMETLDEGSGNAESSQDSLPAPADEIDVPAEESVSIDPSDFLVKVDKPLPKKKKPFATVVKPKKKRKRGYDSSDEMNTMDSLQSTPPASPEDSLIEKRRSGRNVKRKRYVESVDISFSGDDDEDGDFPQRSSKKPERIVELNEMSEANDVMIVDKILSHRKRKKVVKKKVEAADEKPEDVEKTEEPGLTSSEKTSDPDAAPETVDSSKQTEDSGDQNEALVSPTSLKNPRMRKFSMGTESEEKEVEVVDEEAEDEYYVKYKNYSYLHCDWKTKDEIEDKRFDQKLKRYLAKNTTKDGQLIYPEHEADELFNPDFVEVDRVLDVTHNESEDGETTKLYLVKWCSLPYEDSTWEQVEDIEQVKIEEFNARCSYKPPRYVNRPHKEMWKRLTSESTRFRNDNLLRDYQFEGINWLLFNWYNRRNCILADEMGLGKTIQSITFLQKIFDYGIHGPFLVVAPLSTIANWEREFASWTSINAIVYHGSQTSRDMIHTYECFCRDDNLDEIPGSYKMHAVITTYEMIVLDSPHLRDVDWRCLIIDEAHRLKNLSCKLVESLRNMQLEHKVLLTGTPLQNNVEELFALLSFLQPDTFNCQQTFSLEFGNLKDNSQVEKLQELLKPMMLRRLKEDVEKSLAPKEETIIEVELTTIQKKYYRAILERNFDFLAKGTTSGNVPNLMNTMMELRKCCNHPYLIKGAEDKIMLEQKAMHDELNLLQAMIQSSGKLVLIDKLLPRLKQGGHKVLIFSQMVRVLDILEDYLVQRSYFYERIDGCIRGNERQMAIDRFSKKGSDRFVFLLCTRAGGLGINLTAADTVIIFDSDWNPQNDLQAQARCHRIGQQKPVKVYRLITRNSYEREMFDKASLKLGLDKAVLQSISGRQDQPVNPSQQLTKHEVEDLLKRGAYGAIMEDDDAAKKFCEEDIDQILNRRAHTVTLESGEKGSTFSKASFIADEGGADIALDDPNFWEKWAKKADLDLHRLKDNKLILESTRNRKQTRRFGGNSDEQELFAEIGSDSDESAEYDSDGNENGGKKGKFRSRAGGPGGGQRKGWGRRDCFRIEKCLLTFGWGRWSTFQQRGRFGGIVSVEELEEMARSVVMYCLKYYNGDDKIRLFIWDLITPPEHAEKAGIDLKNHEGLTAPVPRGRKGRRNKDDPEKTQDEQSKREWAREINLDVFLPDEGFKKHIQHQCNKILLRIRMLYYIRTEILNSVISLIDSGTKHDEIDLEMVEKLNDPPMKWWDPTCDKCLLIGVYKHGYEKYNVIRADNLLCFLEQVGPPDDRALAAEMDVEPDGDADGDPEYKPTRITFDVDIGESPTPGTPNTEPSSPASTDTKKKDEDAKDAETVDNSKKEENELKEWPSVSELNTRLRRIVTVYQKHYKQMQQRLMNMHRRSGRGKFSDSGSGMDVRRALPQARWTRREEADFYRTVSTFGIERDPRTRDFVWRKFRNIARLEKKSDDNLRAYYLAFRRMCEQICQWKGEPGTSDGTGVGCNEEIPNIVVEPITEERASRTLYRIRLLDKVRCDVLPHPKLKQHLRLCQRSPELPVWWITGDHDHELLVGIDRHGLTRTELYLLSDKDFTFVEAMKEYDANPMKFRKKLIEQERLLFEDSLKSKSNEKGVKDFSVKVETKIVEEKPRKSDKTEINQAEKVEEKSEIKEEKPDDKQPDDKKLEDKQPDVEKTEDKQPDVEKLEDEQPNAEKTEDKQPDVEKLEDEQPNAKKTEDKQPDVEKLEDEQPNAEKTEDKQPDVEKLEDEQPNAEKTEDKQPDDKKPEDKQSVDKEPDDKEPDVKKPEDKKEVKDELKPSDEEKMETEQSEKQNDANSDPKLDADVDPSKETETKTQSAENDDKASSDAKDKPSTDDVEMKKEEDIKMEVDEKEEKSKPEDENEKPVVDQDEKPVVDLSKKPDPVEIDEKKEVKIEKTNVKSDSQNVEDLSKTPIQMSLRSKAIQQDLTGFASSLTSPYMVNAISSRWPKDRVLMLRVEQVCYCIINGEWPKSCQSLLSSISNSDNGSFASNRSQSSTPMSEDRSTPVPTSFGGSIMPSAAEVNLLTELANEKQLQAAMAQLLASNEAANRQYSSRSSRGRRKRRAEPNVSVFGANMLPFSNQPIPPLDKDIQRKIEQLMAGNGPSPQASSSGVLFTPQSSRSNVSSSKSSVKSSSSKIDDAAGNSSASLLANLRELSTSEQVTPARSRSRTSGSSRRRSPSPSQARKDAAKSNSDLSKSQQQMMLTPEQMLAMNVPLQQLMQDALKAGIDPMTAMATFLPLFPWMDPFQAVNPPKSESLPQMPAQPPLPSPAEMEKILKSMGLPPEVAMLPGFLPNSPMPPTQFKSDSQKEGKSRDHSKSSEPFKLLPSTSEKSGSSFVSDRSTPTPAKKKTVSKLDSMFGVGKIEGDSPLRPPSSSSSSSTKKSRKPKFISPAMLPLDTRIPVHNNSEGIRISGKDAPLNKDLADWLKDNSGFVVDYHTLRQQLDEMSAKKANNSGDASDAGNPSTSSKSADDLSNSSDSKPKDILDKAEALIRNAEKLVDQRDSSKPDSQSVKMEEIEEKQSKRDSSKSLLNPSHAPSRSNSSATPTSSSLKQQQQQLSELALLQQMNALGDPAALFGMPPELLTPEVLALLASGMMQAPGGIPPELAAFAGMKPGKGFDEKPESYRSPSRSSTPSRSSPSTSRHFKNPSRDANQLTGDERISIVNITNGKKLSGKQAPELRSLADYLCSHPDYFVASDWSNLVTKSKFFPKDLHGRVLPGRSSTPSKSSSSHQPSTSSANNAAMAAAFGGLPPGAMFPGLMQGQGMMDPVQLMAALQQAPGQGQLDMKALAASGFPMLPFFGGMPNPLLGGAFHGQDQAAAAMAALSQGVSPSPKKDRSSSHSESSDKTRKSKKHSEKSSERSSSRSSSSFKPANQQLPFSGDPMAEALASLQRSGGLPGMPNPFLSGSGGNPLMFPPVMMGGQNNMIPFEMMNPELLAAHMAAFGGLPNMDSPKPSSTPGGSQKRDKRRGSSSSSASQKQSSSHGRSHSRAGTEDQPMDLTQFSASSSSNTDRKSPDKHKH